MYSQAIVSASCGDPLLCELVVSLLARAVLHWDSRREKRRVHPPLGAPAGRWNLRGRALLLEPLGDLTIRRELVP